MKTPSLTTAGLALAATGLVGGGGYAVIHGYDTRHVVSSTTISTSTSSPSTSTAPQTNDPLSAALNKAASSHPQAAPKKASVSLSHTVANPDDATGDDARAAFHGSASNVPESGVSSHNADYTKATPAEQAATLASMKPNRLYIPSINVYASVVPEKVSGKYLEVPQENWRAGWDSQTADPSATSGNTVIAGHVSFDKIPGVFTNLAKIPAGALIYETDSSGKLHAYRTVGAPSLYGKNNLPTSVFYPVTSRALTLITCGGDEGRVVGPNGAYYGHLDNVVVQAVPVTIS